MKEVKIFYDDVKKQFQVSVITSYSECNDGHCTIRKNPNWTMASDRILSKAIKKLDEKIASLG